MRSLSRWHEMVQRQLLVALCTHEGDSFSVNHPWEFRRQQTSNLDFETKTLSQTSNDFFIRQSYQWFSSFGKHGGGPLGRVSDEIQTNKWTCMVGCRPSRGFSWVRWFVHSSQYVVLFARHVSHQWLFSLSRPFLIKFSTYKMLVATKMGDLRCLPSLQKAVKNFRSF